MELWKSATYGDAGDARLGVDPNEYQDTRESPELSAVVRTPRHLGFESPEDISGTSCKKRTGREDAGIASWEEHETRNPSRSEIGKKRAHTPDVERQGTPL